MYKISTTEDGKFELSQLKRRWYGTRYWASLGFFPTHSRALHTIQKVEGFKAITTYYDADGKEYLEQTDW